MARRGDAAGICVAAAAARLAFARAVTLLALSLSCSSFVQGACGRRRMEQEADRIPGIPEESIAVNFPRDFGDPGGVRSALAGRGVTYGINYLGDVLGNPVGGFEQSTRYMGRLEFQLAVDMEKAIGWKGLTFFTNGYQIHGQSISALNLGVLMPVSFIEALPSTRLFELWLQQELHGRTPLAPLWAALGGFGIRHQPGRPAPFSTARGAGRRSWASTCRMAARRIRWRRRRRASPSIQTTRSASSSACSAAIQRTTAKIFRKSATRTAWTFPFSQPLLLYEGAIKYNQDEGELAGTLKLGTWRFFGSFLPQSVGNNGLPIGLVPVSRACARRTSTASTPSSTR